MQFKTHVLSILESNIGGIYHATSSVLQPLDNVQTKFINNLHMTECEAFLNFNLAPLCLRRDIAMLGFIHKVNLPNAHPDIMALFPKQPITNANPNGKRLWNRFTFIAQPQYPATLQRSIFALVRIYNDLPHDIHLLSSVSEFQSAFTKLARTQCELDSPTWHTMFSPRRNTVG